jgi:hypothetical protein
MKRLNCLFLVCTVLLSSTAESANADTFGSGDNTFDIEFVTIGNPGNAADTTGNPNPAGSVPGCAIGIGMFALFLHYVHIDW